MNSTYVKILTVVTSVGFLAFLNIPSTVSQAGPKQAKPKPPAQSSQILSDHWYTVTIGGTAPYEYYNERLEKKTNRLFLQNHTWKREEEYINEEQLGAFAEDNADLTPLFYNFHSTFRSTELAIDGNVKNGKEITVKIHRGTSDLPVIKKNLSPRTILSTFFPVWLGRHLASLKAGQRVSFSTLLEDNLELAFSTVSGSVSVQKPDEFATKSKTQKIAVTHHGLRSVWWVDSTGSAVRIEMPEQNAVVERVPEEKARAFLGEQVD